MYNTFAKITIQDLKIFMELVQLSIVFTTREGGDNGLLLHLSPKFYNNVFLFVGFTTLGTFIKFGLVLSLSCVYKHINR